MKNRITVLALTALAAVSAVAQDMEYEPTAYERGLAYLASAQNADGSWGRPTGRVHETAFAVLAFLNHGETTSSRGYGTNVQQSLKWLLRQEPTNTHAQVGLVHALAGAHYFTRIPILGVEAARHSKGIDRDKLLGSWDLLYEITVQPDSEPDKRSVATRALRRFSADAKDSSPLAQYLETLAMFVNGRDAWKEYTPKVLQPLIKGQATDGSFSLEQAANPIESTAFALLRISVYYRHWMYYLNIKYPEPEGSGQEHDIRIDMDWQNKSVTLGSPAADGG